MYSKTAKPAMRSAAWRISLWATLAYACGTLLVLVYLLRFVAKDIQRRSDAWLTGEAETLADVAEHTPQDTLSRRVVGEVAELATREVPNRQYSAGMPNDSVFVLQTGSDGAVKLWVGAGDAAANLRAIQGTTIVPGEPRDLRVSGFPIPFRVATVRLDDGSHVYLGLSERDELRVLRHLSARYIDLWILLVLFSFGIVFLTTRRMLSHVRRITEAASKIGRSDLKTRVPTTRRNDEVAQLALTLNRMLDRIEISMHQLHTITDSLAHDLRSPLTAIRGKLEMSLSDVAYPEQAEPIVAAVEELDRLAEFLNQSLDVAEAKADALRLTPTEIDLEELLRAMVGLYEPSMSEKSCRIAFDSSGPVRVMADTALVHRMVSNLFDNEMKHLPAGCAVRMELKEEGAAAIILVEDDGPGFAEEVRKHLFEGRVKGRQSTGHGLGLAFVDAVARAHGGWVAASNRETGGARIVVTMPLAARERSASAAPAIHGLN